MDKKTYTIGVLAIIATLLLIGNLIPTPAAQATTTIKDRDYTLCTTRSQRGGEVLYLIDNRSGQIATISLQQGQLQVLATQSLTELSSH